MEARRGACQHVWVLIEAVLDGRGAFRRYRCAGCGAEAVEPASGDRDGA